jgi:hypothetical protein
MEANEMKYIALGVTAMILLVSLGMAAINPIGNSATQSNLATASGSGCCGFINQNELNAVLGIGELNFIIQSNAQDASSHDAFCINQEAANLALVMGTANLVEQSNDATAYGGFATQKQLNAVAVMGKYNSAVQSNIADADVSRVGKNLVAQSQSNLGMIIGEDNSLTQTNDAYAVIPKTCKEDPIIIQNQMNVGLLLTKDSYCEGDLCMECPTCKE